MHIREFQGMMKRIYLHRDSERGKKGTYTWLVEEVQELGAVLREGDKKAVENEFADVLAWLASLANVVDTDLEQATLTKYDGKCPRCRKVPCQCTFSKTHRP